MASYKGLPIYCMDIDGANTGVEIISLVDYPAIERDFIKFSKTAEIKFSINEDKRVVSGPALIPDQPIYRRNSDGYEYYVKYTKEAIRRIAEKFFADHNSTNVNLEHEIDVNGCVYFESYFIDSARGILPAEFADLPDGTWCVSAKINNDSVWDLIKEGVIRGFSIEGNFIAKEPEEPILDSIDDLLSYLKGGFSQK